MVIEEAALSDDWLQIEISDLGRASWAGQGRPTAPARLSPALRARRYMASLLAAGLLALSLAPGARASRPDGAQSAAHLHSLAVRTFEQEWHVRAPQVATVSAQDACPTFPGHRRCVP